VYPFKTVVSSSTTSKRSRWASHLCPTRRSQGSAYDT